MSSIKRILTLIATLAKNKFFLKVCTMVVLFFHQKCSILSVQSHFIKAKRTTVVFQDSYSIIPTLMAVTEEIFGGRGPRAVEAQA